MQQEYNPVGPTYEPDAPYYSPDDVRRLRSRLGMTQQAFANALGTGSTTIVRWEGGKTEPSKVFRRTLRKLELEADERGLPQPTDDQLRRRPMG